MANEKKLTENISGNKGKTIETDNLRIAGNLLGWNGALIQISNISLITTENLNTARFPLWTILCAIIGFALLRGATFFGILLIITAGAACYYWYTKVQETKNHKYLNILLNSGYTYSILFKNDSFLDDVLLVFSNILEEDKKGKTNYFIDMESCTITNSSVGSTVNVGR